MVVGIEGMHFANSNHKNYICLMHKRADLLRFSPDPARKLQEHAGYKNHFPMTMHIRILFLLLFSFATTHTLLDASPSIAKPTCHEFCEAILSGDMKVVQQMVAAGADLNCDDSKYVFLFFKRHRTPISTALYDHDVPMAKYLVTVGANADEAYEIAADMNNTDLKKFLLEHGANKELAICQAALHADLEMLKFLIGIGVDPGTKDEDGKSLTHLASESGSVQMVKYCKETLGLDVNTTDKKGRTCLMWAAQHGNRDVLAYLLQQGAGLEAKDLEGKTAIFYALDAKDPIASVGFLLDNGANSGQKDKERQTVLDVACKRKDHGLAEYLIQRGLGFEENYSTRNYLFGQEINDPLPDRKLLFRLIDAGVYAEWTDDAGHTLLYRSIESKDFEMVKYLIEHKANPSATDRDGYRPICRDNAMLRYLVEHGADTKLVSAAGNTYLCDAIAANDLDLVEFLLAHSHHLEPLCSGGEVALVKAVRAGNVEIVEQLLDHGADCNADVRGVNVLDIALQKDIGEIVALLRSKGAITQAEELAQIQQGQAFMQALRSNDTLSYHRMMADPAKMILTSDSVRIAARTAVLRDEVPLLALMHEKFGFDLNDRFGEKNNTLLLIASGREKPLSVKYLLDHGADPFLANHSGESPIDIAANAKIRKMIKKAREAILENGG